MATTLFMDLANQVAEKAVAVLPDLRTRIAEAVTLVEHDAVRIDATGQYAVHQEDPPGYFPVHGKCTCKVAREGGSNGMCVHWLAVSLYKRATTMLPPEGPKPSTMEEDLMCDPATYDPETGEVCDGESALPQEDEEPDPAGSEEAPVTIPPQYIQSIHGKPHVLYKGLLAMAHEKGLSSLEVRFVSITERLAVAEAKAVFKDGSFFVESADATLDNVASQVTLHFARVALTRAKARALRDALNIGICAVEELEGNSPPTHAARARQRLAVSCELHGVLMEQRPSKKDGTPYWSHRTEYGKLCYGKA